MARSSTFYQNKKDLFGGVDDSPFVSMYAQSFKDYSKNNQNPVANQEQTHRSDIKRQSSQNKTPDRNNLRSSVNQSRKFGCYGHSPEMQKTAASNQMSADKSSFKRPFKDVAQSHSTFSMTNGFTHTGSQSVGTRRNRCTDRFVRYPYPQGVGSAYQAEYIEKTVRPVNHKQSFNVEKEHKIINPHHMEMMTTTQREFKGGKVDPHKKKMAQTHQSGFPLAAKSSYNVNFVNWDNGKGDIFHEKHPQYPVYSLPFKGDSSYKQNHTQEQMKELHRLNEEFGKLNTSVQQVQILTSRIQSYNPAPFESETTNQREFQAFKLQSRPKTSKPRVEAVRTKCFKGHFDTSNKREYVKHSQRIPECDLIPYP